MAGCLFCRIIRGEVPSKKVYEDEQTFAFEDLNPQGPTHVLVIPKKTYCRLEGSGGRGRGAGGSLSPGGRAHCAAERSIEDGYRTVLNVGPRAGQSVFHLHVHLIGGRALRWPPG
jgi:histidine triad (HIT) family protein